MQDFRVKSGLQVSGNIYGINYLTAGNITVTYSGSFGNLTVGGQLVANVTGTVSSLNNFTTANLAEGTNLYRCSFRCKHGNRNSFNGIWVNLEWFRVGT
jgi:hypothetical protein